MAKRDRRSDRQMNGWTQQLTTQLWHYGVLVKRYIRDVKERVGRGGI